MRKSRSSRARLLSAGPAAIAVGDDASHWRRLSAVSGRSFTMSKSDARSSASTPRAWSGAGTIAVMSVEPDPCTVTWRVLSGAGAAAGLAAFFGGRFAGAFAAGLGAGADGCCAARGAPSTNAAASARRSVGTGREVRAWCLGSSTWTRPPGHPSR